MPNPSTQHSYKDWSASISYSAKELEFYDSFSFRFIKSVETAFHFFRTLEVELSSSTTDFLRDRLLFIEKTNIIDDTDKWLSARDLRNKIAHSYDPDEIEKIIPLIQSSSLMILNSCIKAQTFLTKQSN